MRKNTKIRLEDYQSFLDNPNCKDITKEQLNQIIQMHGFKKLHRRPKKELLDTLSAISLIIPQRSTLNETIFPYGSSLTIDQLNEDLDDLNWQECPVQSLETLNDDHMKSNGEDSQKDMLVDFKITVKKPRSKRRRKRRKWSVDEVISNSGASTGAGVDCVYDDLSPLCNPLSSEPSIGFWEKSLEIDSPSLID